MEYRNLGRSGCVVSSFALGTMTFGNETDEAGSHAQLDRFVEAGGTLIDTADVYTRGASEEIIGRWLAKQSPRRSTDVVIATKGRFPMGDGPNDLGLSRRHLRDALDDSLQRLQVDHIDLYQVHSFDPLTPLEETCGFLDDAVARGQDPLRRAVQLHRLADPEGRRPRRAPRRWPRPVTLQPQYNLLVREIEWEIVPACESTGLGLLPWSPLGGGWLTGKYTQRRAPDRRHPARRRPEPRRRGLRPPQRRSSAPGT